jgi:regulator of sigma E protease
MLTLTLAAFSGGLLWAILGIGFLIFIHEYGHFTACRLTRTRVETFSIGFGPRLFGWERAKGGKRRFTWGRRQLDPADHAMDFRVAVIPLGGYVKMAGENPGDVRSGSGDEFSSKTILQRLFIVSAGVIMNAITAFVFYAAAFQGGLLKEPALVGAVEPGSAAWEAGMRTGDRILEVNGHPLTSFTDLRMEAAFLPRDTEGPLLIDREGKRQTLQVKARYSEEDGVVHLGVAPALTLTIGTGPDALVIGPRDAVTVEGIPALGGTEANQRLQDAVEVGRETVEIRAADGRTLKFVVRPPKPEDAPKSPPYRVGIRPHEPHKVKFARGPAAALRPGDLLQAARAGENRIPIRGWDTFGRLAFEHERLDELIVTRNGQEVAIPLAGVTDRAAVARLEHDVAFEPPGTAIAPIPAGFPYVVGHFVYGLPTSPAEGRLVAGERILKVDGKEMKTFRDVTNTLRDRGAKPLALRVAGLDGTERDLELAPVALELRGVVPPLGLEQSKEPLASDGLLDSIRLGAGRLWREVANTFRTIGAFFTGNIAFAKNVAGPITLVNVSSEHSERSFLDLLWFLAYVSVMLAVLNILPIPVLDGGHVVYLAAEKIRGGRPLSDAVIGRMQLVGLLLLLTLMVFAIKNDIKLNFLND